MYNIKIIKFATWIEYELRVNNLFNEGWKIDETLTMEYCGHEGGYTHVIRFIHRDNWSKIKLFIVAQTVF